MTQALVHFNGHWSLCRPAIFGVGGVAVPAWVTANEEGSLVCLCGEENLARTLEEPTDKELGDYAVMLDVKNSGIVELEQHVKKLRENRR
jgi:hypothetical protein